MRGLKNASLCCVCQIHNLTHGAGRNIGACVVGGKPARPCRSSCWHTLPILRCSAFMSATAGSLHPDIVRARNIPAMNTNTFPTNEPYILLISLSNAKCRDIAGFQQATRLSGTTFAHLPKARPLQYTSLSSLASNALRPRGLSIPPTIRIPILPLYPFDQKSQGKSDMSPGRPGRGLLWQNLLIEDIAQHRVRLTAQNVEAQPT